MLEITNRDAFGKVVAQAITDANAAVQNPKLLKRWINAIAKATTKIEETPEFLHWDADRKFLLIWSDSNEIYEANGKCQCEAYKSEVPCWHRAAARIWSNYLAALDGEFLTVKTLKSNMKGLDFRDEVKFDELPKAIAYCQYFAEEFCAVEANVFHRGEMVYTHDFSSAGYHPPYMRPRSYGEEMCIGGIQI